MSFKVNLIEHDERGGLENYSDVNGEDITLWELENQIRNAKFAFIEHNAFEQSYRIEVIEMI